MQNIKQNLKLGILSFLITPYTQIVRVIRKIKSRQNQDLSVLLLPPANFGSLGDEAMINGIIEHFTQKGFKRIGIISLPLSSNWEQFKPNLENIEICHYSLYHPWRKWLDFVNIASGYDRFYCLGADVMDGKYNQEASLHRLKYVSLAAQTGAKATVLGFSFNEKTIPRIIPAFEKLPANVKLKARDPVSHHRLVNHLERPVELVADLAFLMSPTNKIDTLSDVLQWVKQQKAEDKIVIGFNANALVISQLNDRAIDNFVQIYLNTLREIKAKYVNASFVLIPHDFRERDLSYSDVALAKAIYQALPENLKSSCLELPSPFSAAEIKSLAQNLDLVLSSRMHLAIACLGQGTPVACISYQGKFEGLFQHFELEGMLISPEQAFQDGTLGNFIFPLIEERKNLSQHIQSQLPKVKELALGNFQ